MANNKKRRDICMIFVLGVLCVGVLGAIIHVLSSIDFSLWLQSYDSTANNSNLASSNWQEKPVADAKDSTSTTSPKKDIAFSYSQHQACGVKRNVYCVLLDNFSPSSDWQQRIRKTISQYIDTELGGGSTSDYLIYFFQDSECYRQKIASRATEMCNVPNGEVAASSWGKIYYEYGED